MKKVIILIVLLSIGGFGMATTREYDQMLYPVVKILLNNSNGSGVIVESGKTYSLILTVNHVVKDDDDGKVTVVLYPSGIAVLGEVVKVSKKSDLALIRINVPHKYVAKRSAKKLLLFMDVWKVGCGLNKAPFPTKGIVSAYEPRNGTLQVSADTIYGDSGGAFYTKQGDNYMLAGIVVGMGIVRGMTSNQVLTHVAYGYSFETIEEFFLED